MKVKRDELRKIERSVERARWFATFALALSSGALGFGLGILIAGHQ